MKGIHCVESTADISGLQEPTSVRFGPGLHANLTPCFFNAATRAAVCHGLHACPTVRVCEGPVVGGCLGEVCLAVWPSSVYACVLDVGHLTGAS